MHSFTANDAWILLGMSYSEGELDEQYLESLIISCDYVNHLIPSYAEIIEAYNKFLYIGIIAAERDNLCISTFGREILESVYLEGSLTEHPCELVSIMYKKLATYKLKNVCTRTPWNETQYKNACLNKSLK
jgi:hypothetical protein